MSILGRIAGAFSSRTQPAPGSEPGRNDPCWCGSGRKYKRCHLDADRLRAQARAATNCRTT